MKKITLLLTLAFAILFNLSASNKNEKKNKTKEKAAIENVKNVEAVFTLSGTVFDSNEKESLSGACIEIDGKKYYSDLSGNFNIPSLRKGKYTVAVNFISYQPQTMEVDLTKNETIEIAIKQL